MSEIPLPVDHLLRHCPAKQAAMSWPMPVDMHVDALLTQAEAAGENTSRRELVAAILASAHYTDVQLGRLIKGYRTARVRDLLPVTEGENVVPFVKRKPGPRQVAP